jgi:hypothetical protein
MGGAAKFGWGPDGPWTVEQVEVVAEFSALVNSERYKGKESTDR